MYGGFQQNSNSGASHSFFFTAWVILMGIVWDRPCPRAAGPSPPFLGKVSWSRLVWNEASDPCLALRKIGAMQSWFGPEPQQWSIPRAAEGQSFPPRFHYSLPRSLGSRSACKCEISMRHNSISHCLLWRFLRPWHQCKAESFNLTTLQHSTNLIDGGALHSVQSLFHCFSVLWEFHSKPSQRVRLFAVCLCLDSVGASPPFSRSLSKSVTHLQVEQQNAFTRAYTIHAHKCRLQKASIKAQWQWEFFLCYKLEPLQVCESQLWHHFLKKNHH